MIVGILGFLSFVAGVVLVIMGATAEPLAIGLIVGGVALIIVGLVVFVAKGGGRALADIAGDVGDIFD